MSIEDKIKPGLRERKKQKTRATIQQHALRLIREQGYQATTVEQIADASEISPSTFFRYFPTKEAVVLDDDYDPLLIEAFRSQPASLSPLQAFREAVKTGFSSIPQEDRDAVWERIQLTMSVPELRAAVIQQVIGTIKMIAELAAERTGRSSSDLHVQNFAASVMGAILASQLYYAEHPEGDLMMLMDEALSHLENGLPL